MRCWPVNVSTVSEVARRTAEPSRKCGSRVLSIEPFEVSRWLAARVWISFEQEQRDQRRVRWLARLEDRFVPTRRAVSFRFLSGHRRQLNT